MAIVSGIPIMNTIKLRIQQKDLTLNFNEHFKNLALISQSLQKGVVDHYRSAKLTHLDAPEIVGITGACENIDTLFRVKSKTKLPLLFTQTGQLSLEQALQAFPGVFTVIHSGRDEDIEDERHLRQFMLTEEEFDCTLENMTRKTYNEDTMYEALLNHIQDTVHSVIKQILKDHKKILEEVYHRNNSELVKASTKPFKRLEYEKAVKLLQKNGFPKLKFGDDLATEHEATIIEQLTEGKDKLPVFIMKYPQEIKFFNMKPYTKNPKVVLSADLILPYAGEAVGSAVREHNYEKLNQRLLKSSLYRLHIKRGGKYEDFRWYLDIIKQKRTNPHAGYGMGNERVLQYIFGESDIRNVSIFSLLNTQTHDWEKQ